MGIDLGCTSHQVKLPSQKAFQGVGIVSDIFMGAIEKAKGDDLLIEAVKPQSAVSCQVTSRKKRVFSSNLQTFITAPWAIYIILAYFGQLTIFAGSHV